MNPGVGPLFYSNPWVLRMQCKECEIDNSYLNFTQFNKSTPKVHNSTIPKIGLTHKNSPQWSRQLSQRALCGRARARLTGALSKGGKMRGVATNVYLWGKRRKNRRKPVKMKILSSGVVFTFEEGISTSHVCLKGQQPHFVEIVLPLLLLLFIF